MMKNSTVTLKVTLEVVIPVEQEDDDTRQPWIVAREDLTETSIRDWWNRLQAEHEILSIELVESINRDEQGRQIHECVHHYVISSLYDMQAVCSKCGARET